MIKKVKWNGTERLLRSATWDPSGDAGKQHTSSPSSRFSLSSEGPTSPRARRMSSVLTNLPQAGHLTVGYSTGSPVRLVWHGHQQHASSPSLEELVYLRKENNQHNSIISFKQNPNGKARQSSDVSAYLAAADQISSGSGVTATLSASTNAPNNQTSRKDW